MDRQQYDQYGNPYDPNDQYAQYDPNDPYSSHANDDPYSPEYLGNDSSTAEHREQPVKGLAKGDEDYYVSLEPCGRGSSCSVLDSADPKCLIRLVGKGYKKDIELSLDKKMDTIAYKIFRCLEDEGIVLDGVRLQGLPKKNCLLAGLQALCAPFVALSSISARGSCCAPVQCCWCTPMRSSIASHRRSTLSTGCSMDSRQPVCNTREPPKKRRKSTCNPCRMARVCQGPDKQDCVLIKISPSLPKLGGVKCEKRSTGVGTDKIPELEILLQGGKKKCCSSGKMKITKCRARHPKPCRSQHKKKKKPFDPKDLDDMTEEELVKLLEKLEAERPTKAQHYDPGALDAMTEEELLDELNRLDQGRDARLSFSKKPRVNITLVESNQSGDGRLLESGSRLVVPKRGCTSADPKNYDGPLKVFSVQNKNGGFQSLSNPNGFSAEGHNNPTKQRKDRSAETAMILKEVLGMVKEILKSRNKADGPPVQNFEGNPVETSPRFPPPRDEVNAIFRHSDIWMSESDASHPGPLELAPSAYPKPQLLRSIVSSKSINVVARLKKPLRRKRSFKKACKPKFEPPGERGKAESNEKFEKLRMYVETDKKVESARFSPVALAEKKGSTNLNNLIV